MNGQSGYQIRRDWPGAFSYFFFFSLFFSISSCAVFFFYSSYSVSALPLLMFAFYVGNLIYNAAVSCF